MSRVHNGSALGPSASRLSYYCALFVCVFNALGGLALGGLHTNNQTHTRILMRAQRVRGGSGVAAYTQTNKPKIPKGGDLCPYGRTRVVERTGGPGTAFHTGKPVRDGHLKGPGPTPTWRWNWTETKNNWISRVPLPSRSWLSIC